MVRSNASRMYSIGRQALLAAAALSCGMIGQSTGAVRLAGQTLEQRFAESVQPFLKNYCLSCHGTTKQQAKLDLSGYTSVAAVAKDESVWGRVRERLEATEMPPQKAPRQPTPHERRAVLDWLRDFCE